MKIVFLYLPFAFTLLATFLHHRNRLKHKKDLQPVLLYFMGFFLLLLGIPFLIILISGIQLKVFLIQVGFSLGKTRTGLILTLIGIPVTLVAAMIGSKDPKIKLQYPFSKQAYKSPGLFFFYELAYLVLYYFTWEFMFRGLLFFPFLQFGLPMALSIQTVISTLYHIGHPESEIFGALAGGFIFGLVAYACNSFFYTFILHSLLGVSIDTILFFQHQKKT